MATALRGSASVRLTAPFRSAVPPCPGCPPSAYRRRSNRDAKALEAASEALAALAAQHVAETTVDVQGDGSMVAFSRVFATKATAAAAERTAQDSGLLYMDAVTGAWSLLQYNSTLLAAAAAPTVVETAARAASLSVCSFNIRYGTASDGANHWTLRRDMVFDLLNRYSYDLIGVQEALNFQIDEIRTWFTGRRR